MLEKNPQTLRKMFGKIAPKYDFANDFLSLGWHRWWRRQALLWSGVQEGHTVLDAATGTGDMAFLFHKKVGPRGKVVACDFCAPMLEGAKQRQQRLKRPQRPQRESTPLTKQMQAKEKSILSSSVPSPSVQPLQSLRFVQADVMSLPFEDKMFDLSNISFGIRNVQDPLRALREMARVTKQGGGVSILEFGQMSWPLLKEVYGFYQKRLLPHLGSLITGDSQAYRYLQVSSSQFPCGQDFVKLMEKTQCFESIEVKTLMGGMVYFYRGRVSSVSRSSS